MKIYTIEVCACGRIIYQDVNCPSDWRGSGVYDVEKEVHREFRFSVCAFSRDRALKLISRWWFASDPTWCNTLDEVYYAPETIKEESDPEDGTTEEVIDYDYDYTEPKYDEECPIPDCYSEGLPVMTLQEKLDDALAHFESVAKTNVGLYKDKNERVSAHYEGWLILIDKLRNELRK